MGDISELRGLIVIVSFLGMTVLLISLIPGQFYVASSGREVSIPDIFDAIDIYQFAETKTVQTNETGGALWTVDNSYYRVPIGIGNHDVHLYYKLPNQATKNVFALHRYSWLIFPVFHNLKWVNSQGVDRGVNLPLASLIVDAEDGVAKYQARCDHFTLYTQIGYNTTTYPSGLEAAWNAGELHFFFGINFNDVAMSYSAWDLVAKLIFFQLPDTHPIVNAIIAIPIWVSVAYLIYVLIIKIIPFIAGG